MAVVEYRRLRCPEFNTTQIVALLEGLDPMYNGSIRSITWSCYETETNKVVESFTTELPNKISDTYNVFSELTPDTSYQVEALISNIQGLSGEILYSGSQRTAISGGGNYPDDDAPPNIEYFNIAQGHYGGEIIYNFKISNVFKYQQTNNVENGTWYKLLYRKKPKDNNEIAEWTWAFDGFPKSGDDVEKIGAISGLEYTENSVLYEVKLEAINYCEGEELSNVEIREVRVASFIPLCWLDCDWRNGYILSGDNFPLLEGTSHYFTCYSYPYIDHDVWNNFVKQLVVIIKEAEIRHGKLYDNIDKISNVSVGRNQEIPFHWLTVELAIDWLYKAFRTPNDYYDGYHYVKGKQITPDTINSLNNAIVEIKTLIYELQY